jgi:hypothetical protein
MKKKICSVSSTPVRQCANVKSKKHPDVQCPFTASQGEFCSRHSKNPVRFQEHITLIQKLSKSQYKNVITIQNMWRKRVCFLRKKRQGPIVMIPEISENKADICTLEDVSNIPIMYRWSYTDNKKHNWMFDIRSLSMLRSQDKNAKLLNPYTKEEISQENLDIFLKRCTQLRNQKYCLLHINDVDLTPEQLWHQSILDVSMKYDSLGYNISLEWLNMNALQCYTLYYELWELWMYRLDLPPALKKRIVPGWNDKEIPLFKWIPVEVRDKRDKSWWQKNILALLDRLVCAKEKEHRSLGALYGMTALALANPKVRDVYSWLVDI